jgi:hypothetical protein
VGLKKGRSLKISAPLGAEGKGLLFLPIRCGQQLVGRREAEQRESWTLGLWAYERSITNSVKAELE